MRPSLLFLFLLLPLSCTPDDGEADDDSATSADDDTAAGDDDTGDDATTPGDDDAGDDDTGDDDTSDEGPNLLLNGGFEEGEGSFTGVGLHWETNDAQSHPDNDFLDGSISYAGSFSQKIATHGSWDAGMVRQVSGYGAVVEGRTYRLRAMVRTQDMENPAAWYVLGLWWFANDSYVDEVKNDQPAENDYDWTQLVIEATAPAGANRAAAILSAHYDGTAWYDEVVLAEVLL